MLTEYPKPDHPVSESEAADKLDAIAGLAHTIGLELPAVEAGREMVHRSRRFIDQAKATEDTSTAARRIARQLVAGDLDFDGAVTEAARVEAMQHGGVLARAVKQTEGLAAKRAFADIGRELDGEHTLEQARTIAADTLDQIRKLRVPLEGITDAEQATQAGTTTAKAWAAYKSELLPRWEATHQLVKLLRAQYWIDPLPIDTAAVRYGRYDLAREDTRQAKGRTGQPIRVLLDPICDRWLPGGPYTEAEADQFERDITDAQGPEPESDAVSLAGSRRTVFP
jgi:hypothetical protein